MQKKADITWQEHAFLVTGDLDFSNVMSVYHKSLQPVNRCPTLVFDFSQLQSCNSAGLALMMEWLKLARQQNKPIQFRHLSHDIMAIAKAAGIDGILMKAC